MTIRIKRLKEGFTLIELLTVIAIIGILASIIMVSTTSIRAKGRDKKRKADLQTIASALNLKYSEDHTYPCDSYTGGPLRSSDPKWTTDLGSLLSKYISPLPVDPSSGSSYFYYCDNSGSNLKGTGSASGFVLMANLENPGDSDAVNNIQYYFPDGSLVDKSSLPKLGTALIQINANSYLVTR